MPQEDFTAFQRELSRAIVRSVDMARTPEGVLESDPDRDLDTVINRALDLTRTLARGDELDAAASLVRVLETALMLASDIELPMLERSLDLDSDSALDRALTEAIDQVRDPTQNVRVREAGVRAIDLARALTRALGCDLARSLTSTLDSALTHTRDIAATLKAQAQTGLARALARARDRALARAQDMERDLELDLALVRDLQRALGLSLNRNLDDAKAISKDEGSGRCLERARDLDRNLELGYARTRTRERGATIKLDGPDAQDLERAYSRARKLTRVLIHSLEMERELTLNLNRLLPGGSFQIDARELNDLRIQAFALTIEVHRKADGGFLKDPWTS